jgi:hypothetical protein
MLTRHIHQDIKIVSNGKEYTYACYGDHENKDKFYVVPANVEYATDAKGDPKFTFYQYRGEAQKPEEGGFCVFTAKLPFPNSAQKEQIKAELKQGLSQQLEARAKKTLVLVKAFKAKQEADWRSLSKELGYTEDQVRSFAAQYNENQDWQQFVQLPDTSTMTLESVPFSKAEVSLSIADASTGFFEKQLNPTAPSMVGDNEAVFVLTLTQKGSAFFEQALKTGKSSVVAVTYKLGFECVLPPATVKVFYNANDSREFSRTIDRNVWGQATEEKVKDEFTKKQLAGVEVFPGSLETMDDKEKKAFQKELRDWGEAQLADILSNQTGVVDMTNIGQRFKSSPDKVSETLKNTVDVNRTLTISGVNMFTIAPQMQLPSIQALVGEGRLSEFFHEIDLNDDFFKRKTVMVQPNAQFAELKIASLTVKLKYAEEPAKEFLFTSSNAAELQNYAWYFKKDNQAKNIQDYEYSYQVNYQGESTPFKSESKRTDNEVLVINVGDMGVLRANITAGDINWLLVERAQVVIKYEDQGIDPIEVQRIITANTTKIDPLIKPIFKPRNKPIAYRTKFFMKDGSEFWYAPGDTDDKPVDWAKQVGSDIYVNDPFRGKKDYNIQGLGLDKKTEAIIVTLTYTEPGIDYHPSINVSLTSGHSTEKWTVPVIDETKAQVTYTGFIQFVNGTTREISGTQPATNTLIQVGNIREGVLEVEVNTETIDFKGRFKSARLTLWYEDSEHKVSEKKNWTFKEEDSDTWLVDLKDKTHREYKWQAVLIHINSAFGDGGKIYLPGPGKDDWVQGELATKLSLADAIPPDERLAEQSGLLLVRLSKKGIDWDKVETLKIVMEYGKTKQTYRLVQGEGDDDPDTIFLAPLQDGNGTYNWRAEFKMDDSEKELYPGPDAKTNAALDDKELHLNDYISTEYGGDLEK